jgi:cell division protein FtsQ
MILLGFAVENNRSATCKGLVVEIQDSEKRTFVDSLSVLTQVYKTFDTLKGKTLRSISLNKIEELVNTMYYVENSQVYRQIDGYVVVNIQQREPVARVVNSFNESYYIDNHGGLMKMSDSYAARVPVVTGFIRTRYSPGINIHKLSQDPTLSRSEKVLTDVNKLLEFIANDEFLKAWVDQIYVTRTGEFELVPRNGVHTIEFGRAEDIENKFEKLMKFYKDGLAHVGWGSYKKINIKYKNQVVCSK